MSVSMVIAVQSAHDKSVSWSFYLNKAVESLVLEVRATEDASQCQSIPSCPIPLHTVRYPLLLCSPCWKAVFLRVWQRWWDLVILTHMYFSPAHTAAANSPPKLRHRRSSLRPSRSWRCTCRRKREARESPAPSTHSNMPCDVSSRWKVRCASFGLFFMHMLIRFFTSW